MVTAMPSASISHDEPPWPAPRTAAAMVTTPVAKANSAKIAANPANANCRRKGAGRNGKKTKMKIANAIARTPRRNRSHQFWISKRIISGPPCSILVCAAGQTVAVTLLTCRKDQAEGVWSKSCIWLGFWCLFQLQFRRGHSVFRRSEVKTGLNEPVFHVEVVRKRRALQR